MNNIILFLLALTSCTYAYSTTSYAVNYDPPNLLYYAVNTADGTLGDVHGIPAAVGIRSGPFAYDVSTNTSYYIYYTAGQDYIDAVKFDGTALTRLGTGLNISEGMIVSMAVLPGSKLLVVVDNGLGFHELNTVDIAPDGSIDTSVLQLMASYPTTTSNAVVATNSRTGDIYLRTTEPAYLLHHFAAANSYAETTYTMTEADIMAMKVDPVTGILYAVTAAGNVGNITFGAGTATFNLLGMVAVSVDYQAITDYNVGTGAFEVLARRNAPTELSMFYRNGTTSFVATSQDDAEFAYIVSYSHGITCNGIPNNSPCVTGGTCSDGYQCSTQFCVNATCCITSSCSPGFSCSTGSCADTLTPSVTYTSITTTAAASVDVIMTYVNGPLVFGSDTTWTAFDLAYFNVESGAATLSFVNETADYYTFKIEFSATHENVTLCLPVDSIKRDYTGGNTNTASHCVTVTRDTAPVATLTAVTVSPSNLTTFVYHIHFDETVTLDAAKINVVNATLVNPTDTTGTDFDISVNTITVDNNTVSVDLLEGCGADSMAQLSAAVSAVTILHDIVPPVPTVSNTYGGAHNNSELTFTVSFDELVTFKPDLLTVSNGTRTSSATHVNGTTFTVTVTGEANKIVNVTCGAGCATDIAGNDNTDTSSSTVLYDTTVPTAVIIIDNAHDNITATNPISITIRWSEVVVFDYSDLVITGGSVTGGAPATNQEFDVSIDVVPTGSVFNVTVVIPAYAAHDAAGNYQDTSVEMVITFDNLQPFATGFTCTNEQHTAGYVNTTPVVYSLTFNKPCLGITPSSFGSTVLVKNGTLTTDSLVNTTTVYNFTVTPSASDKIVYVELTESACTGINGLVNVVNQSDVVYYDVTAPEIVTFTTVEEITNGITNIDPVVFKLEFSEYVLGVDASLLHTTIGTIILNSTLNPVFYITVQYPADTDTTLCNVSMSSDGVTDVAGNGLSAGGYHAVNVDNKPPTASFSTGTPVSTNASSIVVEMTFSEPVVFTSDSIVVQGCSVGSVTGTGTTRQVSIDCSANTGVVLVNVSSPAGSFADLAGNPSVVDATNPLSFISDRQRTNLTITPCNSPTNGQVTFTLSFQEHIADFSVDSIDVENGTVSAEYTNTDNDYVITVVPNVLYGGVVIVIGDDVFHDAAGNGVNGPVTSAVVYDVIKPGVQVSTHSPSITNAGIIEFTAAFTKDVYQFSSAGIFCDNCDASQVTAVSASNYTFNVVPRLNGFVQVTVLADKCVDEAGNTNNASNTAIVTYDNVYDAPVASFVAGAASNSYPLLFKLHFEELPVTLFLPSDLEYEGCTVSSSWTADSNSHDYYVQVTPIDLASLVLINVSMPANVTHDAAGNINPASNVASIIYDPVPPVPTLSQPAATRTSPILFTLSWDETLTYFDESMIIVDGGDSHTFSASSTGNGVVSVVASTDGVHAVNLTVTIPADIARDVASNYNNMTVSKTVLFDNVRPTVSLVAPEYITLPQFDVLVSFSKPVLDMTTSVLVATGASVDSVEVSYVGVPKMNWLAKLTAAACTTQAGCPITLNVLDATAHDALGNANVALTTPVTVTYDTMIPVIDITLDSTTFFNNSYNQSLVMTLTANELVTLDVANIQSPNAQISVVPSASTPSLSFSIVMVPINSTLQLTIEQINITVQQGLAVDAAGLESTFTARYVVDYDFCLARNGVYDCANVCNGTALLDPECGTCAGGTTSHTAGDCIEPSDAFLDTTQGKVAVGAGVAVVGVVALVCCVSGKGDKKKKHGKSMMGDLTAVGFEFEGVDGLSQLSSDLVICESSSNMSSNSSGLHTLTIESVLDQPLDQASINVSSVVQPLPSAPLPPPIASMTEIEAIDVL